MYHHRLLPLALGNIISSALDQTINTPEVPYPEISYVLTEVRSSLGLSLVRVIAVAGNRLKSKPQTQPFRLPGIRLVAIGYRTG